ncbi:enoyl-CoA hydratase [Pseudoalteromonas ruthenica]|uniref:Enoyl-CoA hydratase n=1 Tax=Pseudoalteromonas ruthenica TaxID=151081 RepID=A0A5S3Z6G4_9GAMM|nr:crotonase/enoyl-CoA hydratase family protein [Pseudoalteromonas ruthenica]TMP87844.1 enoyl-CoA hydratase [Pseudoalteromonas ruthenica]
MITLTTAKQVAYVTLANESKRNALNFEMFKQLDGVIKQIKKQRDLRAVILQAQGPDFCTGLDVKSVISKPTDICKLLFKPLPGNQNLAQRVVLGWQSLSIPVIALLQGRCWGGGMQIALGADIRIASEDASLAIMESRWGLCPDMGASLVLPGVLSADNYLQLAMSAEPVTAQQALNLGLVSYVDNNLQQRAAHIIDTFSARSPDAISAIKRLTQSAYRQPHRKLLAKETFSQIKLLMCKNTRIAIKNASRKDDSFDEYQPRRRW